MPSARVICPHCNAKLRISTSGGVPTRAKCHHCKKTFTPTFSEPVEGNALYLDVKTTATPLAPISEEGLNSVPMVLPGKSVNPNTLPALAPVTKPVEPRAAVVSETPGVAVAPPPATVVEREEHHEQTESAPLSEPPPLVADPANRTRQRDRKDNSRAGGLKPYEVVLAMGLIVAVLGGLGVLWYQNYYRPSESVAALDPDAAGADGFGPGASPTETDLSPIPPPPKLIGNWELRSDDGRAGRLVLRADGTLTASSVDSTSSPLENYDGRWYLLEESGDQYLLEFGKERHSLDGYRVKIVLTSPDSFTLVQTIKNGVSVRDKHRFVRNGPPSVTKGEPRAETPTP